MYADPVKKFIDQYIESKEFAWSERTRTSEAYRLNALLKWLPMAEDARFLEGKDLSEMLWDRLIKKQSPYSRVTSWSRLCSFYDWLIEQNYVKTKINPYKRWRKKNGISFKHKYHAKLPTMGFEEAKIQVEQLPTEELRNRARLLLYSGLRYSECDSLDLVTKKVIGKGGKERDVFLPKLDGKGEIYQGTHARFIRELAKVGIAPHMLRKVFATKLANSEMTVFDLCSVMGWERLETAKLYVAAKKKEELGSIIGGLQG